MKSHIENFINIQLLKEQLRRFGVIGIAAILIYFLGVLLPLLNAASRAGQDAERMIVMILSMSHPIILIWMVLAPFCVVMALYPYHFSERATTAFYTFPITKRQLFWTNFTAGTTLMIVPLFIMCLFLLIPIFRTQWPDYTIDAFSSMSRSWRSNVWLPPTIFPDGLEHGQVVNSVWRVVTFFGRNVVGLMFFFGVFLLAVSLAGSRLISILLCAALPFVPLGVHGLIYGMSALYLFGIHWEVLSDGIARTMEYTLPVGTWPLIIEGRGTHESGIWLYSVIYIAIAAVVFVLAYMCSRMRRHERTGDSVVFSKFKNAMVFALSMGGMVAMGAFLVALFNGRIWWYIGFVLGFALMFVIGQMIAEKAFDIRHKLKLLIPFGGIMLGAYVLVFLIMTAGMLPGVNRVPDSARVESVSWGRRSSFISDPEIIDRTIEIHREILNNRVYLRRAQNNDRFLNFGMMHGSAFSIIYRMNDGSYIRRNYFLTNAFADHVGAHELLRSPVFVMASYHGLQNPQDILYLNMDFWSHDINRDHINVFVTLQEEILPLIDAIASAYQSHLNPAYRPYQEISVDVRIQLEPNAMSTNAWGTDWLSFWTCVEGDIMRLLREFGHID